MLRFLLSLLVLLHCVTVAGAQPAPRTPALHLKFTADANTNYNFQAIDSALGRMGLTPQNLQLRIPTAFGTAPGGIDIDASGIGTGVGLVVENSYTTFPIVAPTPPDAMGWVDIDGNGSAPPGPFTGQPVFMITSHANGTGGGNQAGPLMIMRRSQGTHALPTAVGSGTILGTFGVQAYDASGDPWNNVGNGANAGFEFYADEAHDATHHATSALYFSTKSDGTLNQALKLTSPGNVSVRNGLSVGLSDGAIFEPSTQFHVANTAGNEIMRLQGNATNDDAVESTFPCKTTTVSNTAAALCTVAGMVAGHVTKVHVDVVAHCTGGSACSSADAGASYVVDATCKRVGATTSHITGSPSVMNTDSDATFAGTVSVDCNDTSDTAIVTVTNATANVNISWAGFVRVIDIGS